MWTPFAHPLYLQLTRLTLTFFTRGGPKKVNQRTKHLFDLVREIKSTRIISTVEQLLCALDLPENNSFHSLRCSWQELSTYNFVPVLQPSNIQVATPCELGIKWQGEIGQFWGERCYIFLVYITILVQYSRGHKIYFTPTPFPMDCIFCFKLKIVWTIRLYKWT